MRRRTLLSAAIGLMRIRPLAAMEIAEVAPAAVEVVTGAEISPIISEAVAGIDFATMTQAEWSSFMGQLMDGYVGAVMEGRLSGTASA